MTPAQIESIQWQARIEIEWMLHHAIVQTAGHGLTPLEARRRGYQMTICAAERAGIAAKFASYGVTVDDVRQIAQDLGIEVTT